MQKVKPQPAQLATIPTEVLSKSDLCVVEIQASKTSASDTLKY